MSSSVTIVNYGMGNLFSVRRAFEFCGGNVSFAETPEEVERADRIVLPGVGAFGDGMEALQQRNLVKALRDYALVGRPILGICLGMQLLFDVGEEFGVREGLGLVRGRVVRLPVYDTSGSVLRVPHVGWCPLEPSKNDRTWGASVLAEVSVNSSVFFVHSYMARPERGDVCIAESAYGGHSFPAVVKDGLIEGCQFHPEKSGKVGLKIIANFLGTGGS